MPAQTPKRRRKVASARKPGGKKRTTVKRKSKAKAQPVALVRTSERTTFKRCRFQWEQTYVAGLTPIREAPALRFGTLVHKALEMRYPPGIKRGPKPAETFEKLFAKERKDTEVKWKMKVDGEWDDMLEIGIDMLEMFVEKYGRDEDWKVIQSEMTFQVPVYLPADFNAKLLVPVAHLLSKGQALGNQPLFHYVGTMDGVWENRMDGGVRVIDWKTCAKDAEKEAQGKGLLDEQTTAYWTWGVDWLVQQKILKPRQQQALDGMVFTFLRKGRRDTRPTNAQGLCLNQDGSVSKKQPPPFFHREQVYRSEIEQNNARTRAVQEFVEMLEGRHGLLALYKTPETGSMGHCGFCPVKDTCEIHEAGGDWKLMRDSSMEKWDGYSAHEIEEEGKR